MSTHSPLSILIVQNQTGDAEDLKSQLVDLGCTVVAHLSSGQEALAALTDLDAANRLPDVVLLDDTFSGKNDSRSTAQSICDRYNLSVILLTDQENETGERNPPGSRPYHSMSKPVHPQQLQALIQSAFQQRWLKLQIDSQHQKLEKLLADLSSARLQIQQEIDQRERAEGALQSTRSELEHRVKKQSAELLMSKRLLEKQFTVGEQAEKALRISESRYRSMVENQTELVTRVNPDGLVIFCNQAWQRYLGKSHKRMIGQNRVSFIFDEDQSVMRQNVAMLSADQPTVTYECRVEMLGAEVRWIRWTDQAIFLDEEELAEIQSIGYDVTEQVLAEQKLVHQAMYDSLTGLPNRYLLEDRLKEALSQSRRAGTLVAVAFLDIDDFKSINDALGHNIGDEILKSVARRLENMIRETDTLARMSADDFVCILTNLHEPEDTDTVIQKLLHSLEDPFLLADNELFLTASIGFSMYPDDGEDPTTLLKNADGAMAYSKTDARTKVTRFEPAMHTLAHERLQLTNRLRRAVENEEFTLHYQPQVDLKSHQVIGLEALVRWQHPDRGLVSPGEFIPLAEESGLIHPLGEWVLKEACRHFFLWQEAGYPPLQIAINFSAIQFIQSNFVSWYAKTLQTCGMDPGNIAVEITESVFMDDIAEAAQRLEKARSLGSRVDIDDFGTVYSSLAYLRDLPIDILKIDKVFIGDLTEDKDDRVDPAALVQAIITLGHSLRLKVLAEGVETREQLDTLNSLDCDLAQGYYFARPLPADQLWEAIKCINQTSL